ISKISFERLRQEFGRSPTKNTTVHNPLRTDFQKHYEEIVTEYNQEKDRVIIEIGMTKPACYKPIRRKMPQARRTTYSCTSCAAIQHYLRRFMSVPSDSATIPPSHYVRSR